MNRPLLTLLIFLTTQLLLWLAAMRENIVAGEEVLFITALIGVPLGLFFWKFRWIRWIAGTLLVLTALVVGSLTFEGYGVSYMGIAFLYALIIFLVFTHAPDAVTQAEEPTSIDPPAEPIVNGFYANNTAYHYPMLVKRYQSLLIDFFVMALIMVVATVSIGDSPLRQEILITVFVLFLLLYEPLLTTYNATIGQHLMGIRVRNASNPEQHINLGNAYARSFVKFLLGWLSFITISFDKKHRAIHDFAGSSVVILKKQTALSADTNSSKKYTAS